MSRADLPTLSNLRPTRFREPPSPDVVGSTTKIVKIKQPWANALVTGKKDVENRKWLLTPQCGPETPIWFVVASSKSKPTKVLMDEYKSRLDLQYPHGRPYVDERPDDFIIGKIIGVVKLRGCYTSWQSVWYNPGDLAWVVEEAWEFEDPIDMHPGDGMQRDASLGDGTRAQFGYVEKVREEIAKLVPGEF